MLIVSKTCIPCTNFEQKVKLNRIDSKNDWKLKFTRILAKIISTDIFQW